MFCDEAKILNNKRIGEDGQKRGIHRMKLKGTKITEEAKPGHFISIKCYGGTFLRRPFSIAYTEKELLYVLYKVVGSGTTWLSQCETGDKIDILGPLGKNLFRIHPKIQNPVLVAGGMGVAPLIFLCKELLASTMGSPLFLIGADKKSATIMPPLKNKRLQVITSTQDGSFGYHGNITDVLSETLAFSEEKEIVYAAGPPEMLKETYRICKKHGIDCQVSLESIIACGIGACHGCTVETLLEGYACHQRVCADGPVFDASIINWEKYVKMHKVL